MGNNVGIEHRQSFINITEAQKKQKDIQSFEDYLITHKQGSRVYEFQEMMDETHRFLILTNKKAK